MGRSRTRTTNTYSYMTPPRTQALDAFEAEINSAYDTPDPTIGYTFGKAEQNLEDRFDNPWGFNYSPEVKEASLYAGKEELNQARGAVLREDAFNRKNAKVQARGVVAGYQQPQLVQTGGTSTQTQPILPSIIGAVGTAAGGWLG